MKEAGMANFSELTLERYNLGEVSEEEKLKIERSLALDNDSGRRLNAALAEIRRSDAEIRDKYLGALNLRPPTRTDHRKRRSLRAPLRHPRRLFIITAAAALLCLTLPFALRFAERNWRSGSDSAAFEAAPTADIAGDRIKGMDGTQGGAQGPSLSLYLKTGSEAALIGSTWGEGSSLSAVVLREGDTVQLAYNAGNSGAAYGVIFSIDGRAALTLHYPYSAGGDTRLVSGKDTALAEAYTLDDAPLFETFFFVLSESPLDAAGILDSAREALRELTAGFGTEAAGSSKAIEQRCGEIFAPWEVESLIVYKETENE
jgi:hypothetical protein